MPKLCELTRLRDGPLDLVGGGVFFFKNTMHKDNVKKETCIGLPLPKKYLQGNEVNLHNICKSK